MSYYSFRPYVPVAKRRDQAAREVAKLKKKGRVVAPIVIDGRKIARSFWGNAWCDNLERYSDYETRLPRGRTYVRNGSVVDLQIARGSLRALVSGSELYEVKIDIAVAAPSRWKAICADCVGSIGSLVELLHGKLSKNVMERVCREGDGLFPSTHEITMSCSCQDWAGMCKHVAAALYGAGARLDAAPELLFTLRGVDRAELISTIGADLPLTQTGVAPERLLPNDDVAALFGIDMAPQPIPPATGDKKTKVQPKGKPSSQAMKPARSRGKKTTAPSAGRETERPVRNDAMRVPRSAATITTLREKPPAGTEGSAPIGKPATLAKDIAPAVRKTTEKTASAAESSKATPNAKSRRLGEAPAGRTRAAKWIGARARKARR